MSQTENHMTKPRIVLDEHWCPDADMREYLESYGIDLQINEDLEVSVPFDQYDRLIELDPCAC